MKTVLFIIAFIIGLIVANNYFNPPFEPPTFSEELNEIICIEEGLE